MTPLQISFQDACVLVWISDLSTKKRLEQSFRYMISAKKAPVLGEYFLTKSGRGVLKVWGPNLYSIGGLESSVCKLAAAVSMRFQEASSDLIWLHAGAVARNGRAVLLPGPSGAGKTTLVITLIGRGWTFLSDDLVPVTRGLRVLPFPRLPRMRTSTMREGRERRKELKLSPNQVSDGSHPLGFICFPKFDPLEELAENLTFAQATLGLHGCHLPGPVGPTLEQITNIAALPAYQVTYDDPERAADIIERLGCSKT